MGDLFRELEDFAKRNRFDLKGSLSVALVVTRHAKKQGLPLDPDDLLTERGGQVAGLGKGAVQQILKAHGIERVLAEEAGRTSRGSIGNMRKYVQFLNRLYKAGQVDLDAIEEWWVDQVRRFFAGKPFVLNVDPSKSVRAVLQDLLAQAEKRQEDQPGTTYTGTVLQHLVGAKLDLLLEGGVNHHGASVADEVSERPADFVVGDTAIHVTTTPGEGVIRKCAGNLANGLRPLLVTLQRGVPVAEALAEQQSIRERLDVFDAGQFIAGNLYERARFKHERLRASAEQLIDRYNKIVSGCETDPSLRVEVKHTGPSTG